MTSTDWGFALDSELITKACEGDGDAFAALLAQYYDYIHAVAWRRTGSGADAEDITQDVCMRLAKAIRRFRGEAGFKTWLHTITLNAVRDFERRRVRDNKRLREYHESPLHEAAAISDDGHDALWTAVWQLPAKQGEAVMLVYGDGLSHAEAGVVLDCTENTVSWHLHEARKRLKALLGGEMAQGGANG